MTTEFSAPLQTLMERLAAGSSTAARRAAEAAALMQETLTPADLAVWAQHGMALTHSGWRTWECAEAFVHVSPSLLRYITLARLGEWAEQGQLLARASAEVATAFFQAARPFVQQASLDLFQPWVAGGQWYVQQHPALPNLAVEYFQLSPHIYGHYAPAAALLWGQVGQQLTHLNPRYSRTFFAASRQHVEHTPEIDLEPAWSMLYQMLPHAVDVGLSYVERYSDFVRRFGLDNVAKIQAIVERLVAGATALAIPFLRLVGSTLAFVPTAERLQMLTWCEQITMLSPAAGLDFLHQVPDLQRRLPGQHLQPWIATGLDVARHNAAAGQAYFALESAAAHERLQQLQKLVTFGAAERILQLYTEAMLGYRVALRTTADLPAGLHMVGRDLPTSDGNAIYVPVQVDTFATAGENFAAYKMALLHQIGFYECGTFTFNMVECIRRLTPSRLPQYLPEEGVASTPVVAFEQFFAMFPMPDLARSLFTMLEDARIDAAMMRRYKGIQADLTLIRQYSLQQRPELPGLPLRQALLEGLLQITLGALPGHDLPPSLHRLLRRLLALIQPLQEAPATVYTTAATTIACYHLLTQIPAQAGATFSPAFDAAMGALDEAAVDEADTIALADMFRYAGEGADRMPTMPESTEPVMGVDPVPYRGDMKPELIQKKMRLDELDTALKNLDDGISPLSPEALKALLENHAIDIKSLQSGELTATSGLFVSDLEGRDGLMPDTDAQHHRLRQEAESLRTQLQEEYGALATQKATFLYDEWDYQIGDYRRAWCRLSETILDDEGTTFVDETRQEYAELLAQIRRQFQALKPEMFKKIKRLTEGDEVDLDSAVEALVDRRALHIASDKVYMRRNKRDRSVAAAFLLDMSASTDDEIKEPGLTSKRQEASKPAPRQYDFSGFIQEDHYTPQPPRQAPEDKPRRRIIDVEKAAMVLMADALEALGDDYAIYGFSGYGRDQVEAFIVKEFSEAYDLHTQGRISAMKPQRSTRMGTAIRHITRKLARQDARVKILLLLSDGYPQDFDYGKDRKSKEYGVQDTMMALQEARLKGIQTFCITVDPAGHDYLRQMCPDQQYLVIDDITALPNELPKVYRSLTT